jgi:hypothetical protein
MGLIDRDIARKALNSDLPLVLNLPGLPARLLFGYQCLMVLIDGDPFPNSMSPETSLS